MRGASDAATRGQRDEGNARFANEGERKGGLAESTAPVAQSPNPRMFSLEYSAYCTQPRRSSHSRRKLDNC